MPTGVAIRDPRQQLFDAAERILLRDGINALTSRAVTAEAGCAKGVLHRHFADFDGFLAELVLDRVRRVGDQADRLLESVGRGAVVDNVGDALTEVFESVAVSIVGLITTRDALRDRLREAGQSGVPVLGQATVMLSGYLAAERDRGRIAADADVDAIALALIGSAHMHYAGRASGRPNPREVRRLVTSLLGGSLLETR
ncbi:TetR/AcrR family transcriptional regulator [Solicola gregarius]|uniref:TetR/AcrR family transcriptional regulator n=1 Tax=Solicola gregarius TaxID=2908642 RepID=A0AA46TEV2_9ACTN|nr:TetR/AcrR family transcriptional regulator [Solicola gregarius]UYM03903.1 TetR/AcrR family transcriptional regulator [Solicola gregarius]